MATLAFSSPRYARQRRNCVSWLGVLFVVIRLRWLRLQLRLQLRLWLQLRLQLQLQLWLRLRLRLKLWCLQLLVTHMLMVTVVAPMTCTGVLVCERARGVRLTQNAPF